MPTTVCQTRCENDASGPGAAASSASTAVAHSSPISASTLIRARTSSPRLVSCVDSVVMPSGDPDWRAAARAWKSASDPPNVPGSPPTSLSEISRVAR